MVHERGRRLPGRFRFSEPHPGRADDGQRRHQGQHLDNNQGELQFLLPRVLAQDHPSPPLLTNPPPRPPPLTSQQPPQGQQEQFNADPNVKSALTSIFVSAILPNEDSIRDEGRWITLSDHITNIAQTLPFTWFTTRGSHNFKSPQTPDLSRPKTVPPNYNQYAQNSCVSRSSFNRYWYDLASKFLATSSVKDYEEFTTLIQQEYVKSPPTFPLPAEPATEVSPLCEQKLTTSLHYIHHSNKRIRRSCR